MPAVFKELTENEFPQWLKPASSLTLHGAAKAAPLQSSASGDLVFRGNSWSFGPIAFVVAALVVPYFLTHGLGLPAFVLRRGFALICHQRPERCFWIFGAPVAVCARCVGIYVGAAIGLLMRTSRRIAMRALVIITALNAADALAEVAGLHGNWMFVRFALGLALGAAGAVLISSSLAQVGEGAAG